MPAAPALHPLIPAPAPPVDTPDRADDTVAAGRATAPDSPDPTPPPSPRPAVPINPTVADVEFTAGIVNAGTFGQVIQYGPTADSRAAYSVLLSQATAAGREALDATVVRFWSSPAGLRYRELQRRAGEAKADAVDADAAAGRVSDQWRQAVESGEYEAADRLALEHRQAVARAGELRDRLPVLEAALESQRAATAAALRVELTAAVGRESPGAQSAAGRVESAKAALPPAVRDVVMEITLAGHEAAGFGAAASAIPAVVERELYPERVVRRR